MIALLLSLGACAPAARPPVASGADLALTDPVAVSETTLMASFGGLELKQLLWSTAEASGVAWLASVPRNGGLQIAARDGVHPLTELVGEPAAPWAAINGGFYEDGPMGLVVSGGVERHALSSRGGSGIVQFTPAGVSIVHRDSWTAGPSEALQSIDRLVDGGVSLVHPRPDAHRDARSAVVVTDDRVLLVAAVADDNVTAGPDGIQLVHTVGSGMTLAEFASFLVTTVSAKQALNLDGAVSTQMIVALPTWRWVVRGERGTINGVVIRPAPGAGQ